MRTKLFPAALLASALFFFAPACTNGGDPLPDNPSQVLTDGQWRVSWFWDKDKDETSKFSGYAFRFRADGVLEASKAGQVTSGTWELRNGSSQKLVLRIGTDKPLTEADDDWLLIELGDQIIRLQDDNTSELEELHFVRL